MSALDDQRDAVPGDLCTCGRQAVVVYTTRPDDPVGHCGRNNGGAPADGWCPFCENELRHDVAGWNEDTQTSYPIPQAGRCPRYRLRLADAVQPRFVRGRDQ